MEEQFHNTAIRVVPFNPAFVSVTDRALFRAYFLSGEVIAFPSDTSYGLACDPRNVSAVKKLFAIKKRSRSKHVSCIFSSLNDLSRWAVVSKRNRRLLRRNFPGPFTFLLHGRVSYPLAGVVGARIPDCAAARVLRSIFGAPFTATSANISGRPALYTAHEVYDAFENETRQPALILDGGPLMTGAQSTVVNLTGDAIRIVRKGNGCFLSA